MKLHSKFQFAVEGQEPKKSAKAAPKKASAKKPAEKESA